MTRLRRAPLFIPGDSPRKIEKGLTVNADAIILELEDGVAYDRKATARQMAAEALQSFDFGRTERLVRINALETGLAEADLEATLIGRPDGYVIPKVEDAATLQWISKTIHTWELKQGWPVGEIKLLAIIETALGVINLREVATVDGRLDALMFGAEDLAGDIGAVRTSAGWEVFYAKSAEAKQAFEMGYSGKMAIHPAQLETLHQVFTPSPEVVAAAQRLLEAYEEHQAKGSGVFTLDGKMVDRPMVRAAQKILAKMRQINETD
jgi:citrate lyase subunit beta-like protein